MYWNKLVALRESMVLKALSLVLLVKSDSVVSECAARCVVFFDFVVHGHVRGGTLSTYVARNPTVRSYVVACGLWPVKRVRPRPRINVLLVKQPLDFL